MARNNAPSKDEREVSVPLGDDALPGILAAPTGARGVVLFAHGSGSSRHSPRNRYVARTLNDTDLDPLMERIGDARYVPPGEASHGTAGYYNWRTTHQERSDSRADPGGYDMQGTVTRIFPVAGFGFVEGEDGREFFFHASALTGTDFAELAAGTPVEFEARNGAAGDRPDEQPRAMDLHLGEDTTPAVDNEPLPLSKVR